MFSSERNTVALKRASLGSDTIRDLMILKHWLRLEEAATEKGARLHGMD